MVADPQLPVPQGQIAPVPGDPLATLDQRLATAAPDDLILIVEARERVSESIEKAKDRKSDRFRAILNEVTNAIISVGAVAGGTAIVVIADDPRRAFFGAFLAGAGLVRVASEYVLKYGRFGGGQGGNDDGDGDGA